MKEAISSQQSAKIKHYGRLGPPPIMKLLVGAVREPPLRVDFHDKAMNVRLRHDYFIRRAVPALHVQVDSGDLQFFAER
jgi:hypothetical protein